MEKFTILLSELCYKKFSETTFKEFLPELQSDKDDNNLFLHQNLINDFREFVNYKSKEI